MTSKGKGRKEKQREKEETKNRNLVSVIHGQCYTSSSFEFENLKLCLFIVSIRYCINCNNLDMMKYVNLQQFCKSPTRAKIICNLHEPRSSEFESQLLETGNLPNTNFSLPGPWITVSVALYWSPKACLPMQIGLVQPERKKKERRSLCCSVVFNR